MGEEVLLLSRYDSVYEGQPIAVVYLPECPEDNMLEADAKKEAASTFLCSCSMVPWYMIIFVLLVLNVACVSAVFSKDSPLAIVLYFLLLLVFGLTWWFFLRKRCPRYCGTGLENPEDPEESGSEAINSDEDTT